MADNEKSICRQCGTELVPAKENITISGKLKMDGTWNFNDKVCPKCHPELVDVTQ